MKITFRLDGKKEVLARAKKITLEQLAATDRVLWQTAGEIDMQAKNNCRSLFDRPTGRLMGSITMAATWGKTTSSSAPAKSGDAVSVPKVRISRAVVVGTNVEYSRRIEHGFYGPDKLGRVYAQPGKPYLYPAFFSIAPELKGRLKKILRRKA